LSALRILVGVKRVPAPGAQITLTADGARHRHAEPGFHDEPARGVRVEEAIRLVDVQGGDITVLTVGPPEADEQFALCDFSGAQHAVRVGNESVASGEDPDPQATARAIADAVRALEATPASSTCSCSATSPPTRAVFRSVSGLRARSAADRQRHQGHRHQRRRAHRPS